MKDYYLITDFETTGLRIAKDDVPIEVGMLLTDDEYNVLEISYCYINPFKEDKKDWTEYEQKALKVHKIPFSTILSRGKQPLDVIEDIDLLINTVRDSTSRNNIRIIIISKTYGLYGTIKASTCRASRKNYDHSCLGKRSFYLNSS